MQRRTGYTEARCGAGFMYSHSHERLHEAELTLVDPTGIWKLLGTMCFLRHVLFWVTGIWSQTFWTEVGLSFLTGCECVDPQPFLVTLVKNVARKRTMWWSNQQEGRAVTSFHQVIKNTAVRSWQDEREVFPAESNSRWHALGLAWKQDVNIVELLFGGNRLQRTSSDVGGRFLQQIILHVVENKQIAWVVWSMPGSSARVFSLQRAYPPL